MASSTFSKSTKTQTKQPTVRMNLAAKSKLDQIQGATGTSSASLLDRAVDLLERDLRSRQIAEELDALSRDTDALRRYIEIGNIFDGAAGCSRRKP